MTNLKRTIFASLSLLFFSYSTAQQQCAFDAQREVQLQDPNFRKLEKAAEKRIEDAINNKRFSIMPNSVLNIPVVVHVLHLGETIGTATNIADAQIQSSIDNLNDFYRDQTGTSSVDFEIQFALALRDPSCDASTGINRIDASSIPNYSTSGISFNGGAGADQNTLKDLSRWPETDYFNIWIVTEINGNNGGSGFQGYANFFYGNSYEGSVMMHSVFGYDPTNANPSWPLNFSRDNSTVVHEAGHYFHLYHTFQGDDTDGDLVSDACPADTTVGLNSDGCADTVPHQRETSTCPVNNTCTANPWVDSNTINNIMSYYNCTDLMTNDQKTRSRAAMEGTSLVNSKGALVPDANYTAPVATCSPNAVSTDVSGIISVALNGLTFSSFSSAADGGNIEKSANCVNYFEIDAEVNNTLNVGVFVYNWQQLGIWIDWNDDGDFEDEAEQQFLSDEIPENSTIQHQLIYPTNIPYNDYVRIRLITEVDDRYGVPLIDSPCFTSLVYGQSEDYSIFVKPSSSIVYTYNNAWLPSNPVGVSTAGDTIIIDAGTANISANINSNTLTVNPGAALTIDSGVTLTASTMNLNSTSQLFSSLISNGTITGTVHYNRHVSQVGPVGTNDLISAPVSGQTFGSFDTANINLPASGTLRAFAPYDTSTGNFQNYDTTTNMSTLINDGIGYRAATTDGGSLTFTGTVRTNDVLDISISDAAVGAAWNLIGNPYPSYLDFAKFFNLNADEFETNGAYQAVYGYDGNASDGWVVWNFASILDGTVIELIAPGQAFFVKAKTGGGLIDFTTEMRSAGTADDFIPGRQTISNLASCKINLISSVHETSTQIYFIEGTTRGMDNGYDAATYIGDVFEFAIVTNLVEDNIGLNMAIQTLPYDDFNDLSIPLGIYAEAGVELTIEIDSNSSLPTDIWVYLEDTVANTLTLLNDVNYTFSSLETLNGTGRFHLRYSSEVLLINNTNWNNLQIHNNALDEIVIKGLLINETLAHLYDIQGRLVMTYTLNQSTTDNTLDVSSLGSGIYVIKVFNNSQLKTQKVIIK
jgi:hypothetical protein